MYSDDEQLLLHLLTLEEEAAIQEEQEYTLAAAAGSFVLYGAEESRRMRAEHRQETCLYLTQSELLSNPRSNTPWHSIFQSQSDRAFITMMGLDVRAFTRLLDGGFAHQWNTNLIPHADNPSTAVPHLWTRSLDAAGALGLILHYLNSTMHDISLMEIFALIPTTVSRYLTWSLTILRDSLQELGDARIVWPEGEEFEENNMLILARHPLLTGAFGSLDGLNLLVQTSVDQEIENATFNGWLHEHFVSSVFTFNAMGMTCCHNDDKLSTDLKSSGEIIACKLNAPGSWHDSRVAKQIYEKLRTQTPDGFYLVANTAFPRGTDQIAGRIRAPVKDGTRLPADNQERQQLMAFDRQLLSYRQTAEWGNRGLQGSFGQLRVPLPVQYKDL